MAVAFSIVFLPMAVEASLGIENLKAILLLVRLQLSRLSVVQSLMVLLAWYPASGMAASIALALMSRWLEKSEKV